MPNNPITDAPKLKLNETYAGFTLTDIQEIPEIPACAYLMRHISSGARLMWLSSDDPDTSFAIAFKTPPKDDTGVFHILEHSVLCGSKRYPVKEPFVHLLKSSMNTFLNAMTFPDKTVYPVSSTNSKDLMNLVSVYVDAVFFPEIYRRESIFEQEGHHLELADPANPASAFYNGVVFNEMQGALSDPDEVLMLELLRSCFPDTAYGFESGGDPLHIPELSYEDFLDHHRRHYNLANSQTVLYGDLDILSMLEFLNKRYTEVLEASQKNPPAGLPNPLIPQNPVCLPAKTVYLDIPEQNAALGLCYVLQPNLSQTEVLAWKILVDALTGSNDAPLKKQVLDSGLGNDFFAFFNDSALQPQVFFFLKTPAPEASLSFRSCIEEALAEWCAEGLDATKLTAALASAEFSLREQDFGRLSAGVVYTITALQTWLYDDDRPVDALRYEEALAELKTGLSQGYFEDLLRKDILKSAHRAQVLVCPPGFIDDTASAKHAENRDPRLPALSSEACEALTEEVAALRREQEAPDSPEALATLPTLTLADIGKPPAETAAKVDENTPIKSIAHDLTTHGILYAYYYFGLEQLRFDELPLAALLADLLSKLDTDYHSSSELDTLLEANLGSFSVFTEVFGRDTDLTLAKPYLVLFGSALSAHIPDLISLPKEIWAHSNFDDTEKIKTLITQRVLAFEQTMVNSGNAVALSQSLSAFSAVSAVSSRLSGLEYYRFLKGLLVDFDEKKDALTASLQELCHRIFVADDLTLSCTGSTADRIAFQNCAGDLDLSVSAQDGCRLQLPPLALRNVAYIVPSQVNFCACAHSPSGKDTLSLGSWMVGSRVLTLDYLWNEVRVKGGAYGVNFSCGTRRLPNFSTFRDPNIDASFERFERAASWLEQWNPGKAEFEGYVISTVASHDAPVRPRQLARRQDMEILSGHDPDFRNRIREEARSCTLSDIRALAAVLADPGAQRSRCVLGNREAINEAAASFDEVVELLQSC